MKVMIQPTDLLFFRNAKPFKSGEGAYGESLDLPFPSTIYGAIRSHLLFEHCKDYDRFLSADEGDLSEVIGTPQKYGSLRIKDMGIWDGDLKRPLYPIPGDLVCHKDGESDTIFSLLLQRRPEWSITNSPTEYVLFHNRTGKVESPERTFIHADILKRYLNNDLDENLKDDKDKGEIVSREYRTGLKKSHTTKTAEEGYLYRTEMIRLSHAYSFFVEVSGTEGLLSKRGLLKLGGVSRSAEFKELESHVPSMDLCTSTREKIEETGLFKIYLSTPAILDKGWIPGGFNQEGEDVKGDLLGMGIQILAASIKKYQLISGWDIAGNKPRPGFRVVPAGSVYYCKLLDKGISVDDLLKIQEEGLSDRRGEEGFGRIYIGGVKNV